MSLKCVFQNLRKITKLKLVIILPFSTELASSGMRIPAAWHQETGFSAQPKLLCRSRGLSASLQALLEVSQAAVWRPFGSPSCSSLTLRRTGGAPAWRDHPILRRRSQWGAGWREVCRVWRCRPRTSSLLGPGTVVAVLWQTSSGDGHVLEHRRGRSQPGGGCALTRRLSLLRLCSDLEWAIVTLYKSRSTWVHLQ